MNHDREYRIHAMTTEYNRKVMQAMELIETNINGGYISISGGKDSEVLAHMAAAIMPRVPMWSWMDDLEWPETRVLLENLKSERGWNVNIVYRGGLWEQMVGIGKSPFDHNYFYDKDLIPNSRRMCVSDMKTVFLGLRADESKARMKNAMKRGTHYAKQDGMQVVAPLQFWSATDIYAYLISNDLPIHPVYSQDAFHEFDPGRLRVSWWIPSPEVSRHGYCRWLQHYHINEFNKLVTAFPETRCYI